MAQFSWFDGSIVGLYLLVTMLAGIMVRKHVGKVEHFLVAGREMNVYLGIASLAATEFGIVTCMYSAENGYLFGFAGATPGILVAAAMLLVGRSGFCVRRLRDSGVITIPELLEQRFGPRIRWAAGVVIVLGGLLNMGVFLRVGGEFLVLATGLDVRNLEITMTLLLAGVALYTILGGMLSVLVTDYLQFIVMSIGLIAVTVLILMDLGWNQLFTAVESKHHAGGFNPFLHKKMGWEYVVFNGLSGMAAVLTWQTIIARLLAARDAATGMQIYSRTSFFFVCRALLPGVWGIAALAALHPDALAGLSEEMQAHASLYAMPLYLRQIVPVGLAGLLVASMLAAEMSTDSSYMLTWAGIIYNDLLAPFRKAGWSERRGLLWNRWIVALIGVFLLIYGLWYPLKGDLWTYLAVTGAIYLSSISTLLIACCYWPRANNWGAAAAIFFGAALPITYLVLEKLPATAKLAERIGPYRAGIATYVLVGIAMVIGSLLKPSRFEQERN